MRIFFICLVFFLSSCGGGGGGGGTPNAANGNLAVSYSYSSSSVQRFSNVSIKPNLNQLGPNTARFTLISGVLPTGLQLNANTGEISGVPTAQSTSVSQINVSLSVEGFSGTLNAPFSITVSDLGFYYLSSPFTLEVGVPIAAGLAVPRKSSDTAQSTATFQGITAAAILTFSVDPATPLPLGLSLNSSTGEVTGSAVEAISVLTPRRVNILTALSYAGINASYSTSIGFIVNAPDIFITYAANSGDSDLFYGINNQPLRSAPLRLSGGRAGDTIDNIQLAPGPSATVVYRGINSLPAGVNFDGATGHISGTPTAIPTQNIFDRPCSQADLAARNCFEFYWMTVTATFRRGSYSMPTKTVARFEIR